MKLIFIVFCLGTFSYAHTVNDKLILSYSKSKETLNKELHSIEKFLIDDTLNAKLLEAYDLNPQIEKIKKFYTLTLKPIRSQELKIKLRFLLNQEYSNMFFISNIKTIYTKKEPLIQITKTKALDFNVSELKSISFIETAKQIGFEWIALLFLSIIGLLYSLYSRRKSILLNKTQHTLKEEQSNIEKEVNEMEKMHA